MCPSVHRGLVEEDSASRARTGSSREGVWGQPKCENHQRVSVVEVQDPPLTTAAAWEKDPGRTIFVCRDWLQRLELSNSSKQESI